MELVAAAALLFAGLALVAVALIVRSGRTHDDAIAPDQRSSFELLRAQVAELARATTSSVGELRGELHKTLTTTEERMGTRSGETQRALGDLAKQLTQLSERSERIGELAREVGSLHDLLKLPQPRGGFGELMLERLLADNLPVPIDAKFPMEPFQALLSAATDEERKAKRRAFLQQVKRHVDAVGRYVRPDEGTIDLAILYMPAEQVFYSGFVVVEDGEDMRAYCAQHKVIPASPNTLVLYLQLVALGMRGLAIEQRSREMHDQIRRAALELEQFRLMYDQLGRHVENASKKFIESLRALDRASSAVETLGQTQLAAAAQPTLALEIANAEMPGNGKHSRSGVEPA
ncbi:MAG: DNA recombination protein RmuC [Chloroflexi bacterium]|nr:DNA recombination protein RmuC [Chloroflexota bacterium]